MKAVPGFVSVSCVFGLSFDLRKEHFILATLNEHRQFFGVGDLIDFEIITVTRLLSLVCGVIRFFANPVGEKSTNHQLFTSAHLNVMLGHFIALINPV